MQTVNRETWREAVRDNGISKAVLAYVTGKSQRAVRSYLEGRRRPSDEWIAKVADLIETLDGLSEKGEAA